MQSLMELAAPKAEVVRDGQARELSTKEVVPGDTIVLTSGDSIPADGRLLDFRPQGERVRAHRRIGSGTET